MRHKKSDDHSTILCNSIDSVGKTFLKYLLHRWHHHPIQRPIDFAIAMRIDNPDRVTSFLFLLRSF